VLLVGTQAGQGAVDAALTAVHLPALPWEEYFGGFDTLLAGTAPVFWMFFLATGLSMFVLRVRDRGIHRPFSAPLFPLEPIVFCLMCLYMLYSALVYAKGLALLGLVPLAVGLPLYAISCRLQVGKKAGGVDCPGSRIRENSDRIAKSEVCPLFRQASTKVG
jgi:basic amino acid/polyamine antiporter, APA family